MIKTKSLATDEKLFINVFHHYLIEEDKFPVNDRITVVDKKGEQCIAYGIAIPTVLFERGEENTLSKEEVTITKPKLFITVELISLIGYNRLSRKSCKRCMLRFQMLNSMLATSSYQR